MARVLPLILRVALVGLCAGAVIPVLTGTPAGAADSTVDGGRLDWGIKASFQSYVTGPIAKGEWSLLNGASTTGSDRFRFHSASGAYDPANGAFEAAFFGGVRFVGHKEDDGDYQMDLTIANPRVVISGGEGTLYADVTDLNGTDRGVAFADLGVAGLDLSGGTTSMILSDIPVTLTAEGAKSFAGYYEAGTQMDPFDLSADMVPAGSGADDEKSPSTEADDGAFTGAVVDWGVRRTYREYVTGELAKGAWTLGDGAQDGGAVFRFGAGEGKYDEKKSTVDAAFAGTLHFTGQNLDLALGGVSVSIEDGKGVLAADVTAAGATTQDVPLVTFPAELAEDDGLVVVEEAPATLTAEGATVFGGLYAEGTEMDPVSLAVPVEDGAEPPALPDLGSEPSTAPAETGSPVSATNTEDGGGLGATLPLAAGGVAVLAGAVAATVVVRRRRAAAPASGTDSGPLAD